jgi:hypothetical protein
MIQIFSDIKHFQKQLDAIDDGIYIGIKNGVDDASKQLIEDIDNKMYIPLRFSSEVNRNGSETIAKVVVFRGEKPKQVVFNKRFLKINRLKRRLSRKAWEDYVQEQVEESERNTTKSVDDSIRKEIMPWLSQ